MTKRPIRLSLIWLTLVSLSIGYLIGMSLFTIAWISKYQHGATPLITLAALPFMLNFAACLLLGLVVLPAARVLANRTSRPGRAFVLASTAIPGLLMLAALIAFATFPGALNPAYEPLQLGEPPVYYAAAAGEVAAVMLGCGLMAVAYLLLSRGSSRWTRRS